MANQGADVRSLQSLSDLRSALGRFSGEAREAMVAAALEIQRTQEWLHERELYWIRVVEQCRAAVPAAHHALQVCQSACARERAKDSHSRCSCEAEQHALMRAEAALREAQGKLPLVRHWQARVNQAAAAYQAQARRLAELSGPRAERARAFLSARQAELEHYLGVGLGAVTSGPLLASDNAAENRTSAVSNVAGSVVITGFGDSILTTDAQVADHLRKMIPAEHTAHCPSVVYEPHNPEFVQDPQCLAFFMRRSHEIKVGPSDRFAHATELLATVTHEVGHNVHQNLQDIQSGLAEEWQRLHAASWQRFYTDGDGFVSSYARTNVYEDFAESYRAYIHDPEQLEFMSPDKYAFMRTVFAGRTYPNKEYL